MFISFDIRNKVSKDFFEIYNCISNFLNSPDAPIILIVVGVVMIIQIPAFTWVIWLLGCEIDTSVLIAMICWFPIAFWLSEINKTTSMAFVWLIAFCFMVDLILLIRYFS